MVADGPTDDHALVNIDEELRRFVATDATAYIRSVAGDATHMRCPKGTVNSLADRWFCKETKHDCPLDAVISRVDLEGSLRLCDASELAKAEVRGAVSAGYAGLHHQGGGSYFCPGCRDVRGYGARSVYYPFELQTLRSVFESEPRQQIEEIRRGLVVAGFNPRAMNHGLCPDCLLNILVVVRPTRMSEFRVLRHDLDFGRVSSSTL